MLVNSVVLYCANMVVSHVVPRAKNICDGVAGAGENCTTASLTTRLFVAFTSVSMELITYIDMNVDDRHGILCDRGVAGMQRGNTKTSSFLINQINHELFIKICLP